jgi:hypothetical protein
MIHGRFRLHEPHRLIALAAPTATPLSVGQGSPMRTHDHTCVSWLPPQPLTTCRSRRPYGSGIDNVGLSPKCSGSWRRDEARHCELMIIDLCLAVHALALCQDSYNSNRGAKRSIEGRHHEVPSPVRIAGKVYDCPHPALAANIFSVIDISSFCHTSHASRPVLP